MSMSTFVRGVREQDDQFKKMMAVVDACRAAGLIDLPRAVTNYFKGTDLDGVPLEYFEDGTRGLEVKIPVEEEPYYNGTTYEVDVTDLPPGVVKVRIRISY